jgi:predicted ArsR family transcriptional regulator
VTQPSLFDAPPTAGLSRGDDPATSRAAARSVDLAARKAEVLAAMRYIGVSCTADEITDHLRRMGVRMDAGAVRSRLNQLRKDDGAVRKVGVRVVPKPVGTGRPSTTWVLA